MQANRFSRSTVSALLGLILMALLFPRSPAWANNNESMDLVAPYGHFPLAIGPAPGPFTTHYLISNTSSVGSTVNVKCFNDGGNRVGPDGGVNVALTGFEMEVRSPVSLELTTDPAFGGGLGWCYFASNNDNVAVTFLMGTSVSNDLITTDDARTLMADTAQAQVTVEDANIPYWTQQGSWSTFIVALNPTTVDATLAMNFFSHSGGSFLGTWTGDSSGHNRRDMDVSSVVDAIVGAPVAGGFGMADVHVEPTSPAPPGSETGFVGWVVGFNGASGQAFMYPIPLDEEDTGALVSSDRPS